MYTLIGSVKSRALRVAWMLEELGQAYKIQSTRPHGDAVTQHYSAGKIPVLLVEGQALTDSVAIMTYLGDTHQGLTFPAGSIDRAVQDGHTQFVVDEFDSILWTAARHSFVLPEDRRVPEVKDSLKWEFTRSLARLEERLSDGPYLMGDTLTIPDLLAAHCSRWAKNAGFPAPSDKLTAYFEALQAREAFQRAASRE